MKEFACEDSKQQDREHRGELYVQEERTDLCNIRYGLNINRNLRKEARSHCTVILRVRGRSGSIILWPPQIEDEDLLLTAVEMQVTESSSDDIHTQ